MPKAHVTKKHSRRYTREQRLRHEARMMRLASIYGIKEPWLTHWVKRHHDRVRCSCDACHRGRTIQSLRLEDHDRDETPWT